MHPLYLKIQSVLTPKTKAFLKRSLLFAFLYATMLYTLVRLFFYDFPFTIGECFELHTKIWLTVWLFIIGCKLFCAGIIAAENHLAEIRLSHFSFGPIFRNTLLIMMTATMAYATNDQGTDNSNMPDASNNMCNEPTIETEFSFQEPSLC